MTQLKAIVSPPAGLLAALVALVVGCAKVQPAADYQRAAQLITERTGSEAVYDPQADDRVEQHVDALLADGLTVEEAVRVALLNNRGLQSAFQEIGVSRADVVQSGLLTNPTFSLVFQIPEGGGLTDFTFNVAQELVDLWQIPVRKKVAQAQLEATILDVAQRAFTLASDVRVRSYELLALQRGEETLRENLRLVEQSLQLAQRQFEAGATSQLDVNLARASVIDVRLELIAIERESRVAGTTLGRLLNLTASGKPWALKDTLPEIRPVPDTLLATAMDQRLDAKIAVSRVREAESELRLQGLKIWPSLQAGFDLEVPERRALPGRNILADTARESIANGALTAPPIESRAQRALARREIINAKLGPSLAFTAPIWDQNQAQIAKAGYRVVQRRKDFEDVVDRVANEVQQASEVARNAELLVQYFTGEALPQGRISVEGAQKMYQAGLEPILVLIEAQDSLITRRRAYVRALGQYAVAMAELQRAAGGSLPTVPTGTQPAAGSRPAE